MRQDELVRNAIEGKFGQGKRRFRLVCIRGKLPETSGSMIALCVGLPGDEPGEDSQKSFFALFVGVDFIAFLPLSEAFCI
jgi:hypothetical protein